MPDLGGVDILLVAALITLLPAFSGLREVDARVLRRFHKIGAIAFGAARWAQHMKDAPFWI